MRISCACSRAARDPPSWLKVDRTLNTASRSSCWLSAASAKGDLTGGLNPDPASVAVPDAAAAAAPAAAAFGGEGGRDVLWLLFAEDAWPACGKGGAACAGPEDPAVCTDDAGDPDAWPIAWAIKFDEEPLGVAASDTSPDAAPEAADARVEDLRR